jgi:hypothetical protein
VTKPLHDPIIEETPSMGMATIFWISKLQKCKKIGNYMKNKLRCIIKKIQEF